MRHWWTVLLAAGLLLSAPQSLAQGRDDDVEELDDLTENGVDTKKLDLVVGENKTIPAAGVKNYSEGTPGIADVKLTTDGSKFVIVGKSQGTTSLLLINKDGTQTKWMITVFARSPEVVREEVEELLEKTPGIRVRRVGARFFIEGGVNSSAEKSRVDRIAALYPGQVESLVVVGGGAADRKINIRVDFFFVQYEKWRGFQAGVDWPTKIGGGNVMQNQIVYDFLEGTTTTATTTVINQPLPALDIAANRGWAKVHKQSTVITVNGTEAVFESGGEQNFEVDSNEDAELVPLKFGTDMKVTPRLDPKTGDLEIGIDAKVMDWIPPISGTTVPGRAISTLKTQARLKLGQSLILSGIRTRSHRSGISGLPFLSTVPVLGVLFGSHSFDAEDIEGAIFIIPTAVESVPKPAMEMVEDALKQFDTFKGDMDTVESYDKQPKDWETAR